MYVRPGAGCTYLAILNSYRSLGGITLLLVKWQRGSLHHQFGLHHSCNSLGWCEIHHWLGSLHACDILDWWEGDHHHRLNLVHVDGFFCWWGGREGFQLSVYHARRVLGCCLNRTLPTHLRRGQASNL